MPWGRLDDRANSNPKLLALSDAAWRMWGCALIYCQSQLTDGFVPEHAIYTFGVRARNKQTIADELCRCLVPEKGPLWHRVPGGFQLHDYLDWNDSRLEVETKRERDRKRKGFHPGSGRNPRGNRKDSDRPTSTTTEEITSTGAARRPVENREPDEGTFGLYCVIAAEAREESIRMDRTESVSNIAEIFKTLCAQRQIAYSGEVASRAIAAVLTKAAS